jgi:flagellar basal body-associated protein FliL
MTNVSGSPARSVIPPQYVRVLKIAIAVMTVLLIAGIVALVFGVARQVSKLGTPSKPAVTPAAPAPYSQVLDLGQGKLETVAAGSDYLILHWKSEGGDILLSIDPKNGHELGRIQLPQR